MSARGSVKSFAKASRCAGDHFHAPDLHASESGTMWSISNVE